MSRQIFVVHIINFAVIMASQYALFSIDNFCVVIVSILPSLRYVTEKVVALRIRVGPTATATLKVSGQLAGKRFSLSSDRCL